MPRNLLTVALSACLPSSGGVGGDPLLALHRDFWAWRVQEEPINRDDIPRAERPSGSTRCS